MCHPCECEDLLFMKKYHVYILTNATHTILYIGFTSNIENRIAQHKLFRIKGFTQKYRAGKLIYMEEYDQVNDAIAREKQLKHWKKQWKIDLISNSNPGWRDLSSP